MKSVLIIGIGRFGHHLCIDMANRGNEVMIIDKMRKRQRICWNTQQQYG